MNWDDLRVFLALARNAQLRLAADVLKVDATTVGRRITRLENDLSTTLFEQGASGFELTAQGRELLQDAEQVEAVTLRAQERMGGGQVSGRIRLCVAGPFASFLAGAIHRFKAMFPDIVIDLVISNGPGLDPGKYETDISIGTTRPESGLVSVRRLVSLSNQLYAAKSYLEQHGPIHSLEEVARQVIIGGISELPNTSFSDRIGCLLPEVSPAMRSQSTFVQHVLIQRGVGVGLIPRFLGETDPALVPILPEEIRVDIDYWIVMHQFARSKGQLRLFVRWLDELVASERDLLCA